MAEVWYTSDLHLGHAMVADLRGFGSVEEHDQTILDNWRRAVKKDDVVWVLGDLTLQNPSRWLSTITALPGRKHLVAGNHDRCHPMHRDAHKWQARYLTSAFSTVQSVARRKIGEHTVLLSHFPYDGDHTLEERHTQWRLRDEGEWLLHGHTHGPEQLHGHQLHVGLDAWNLKPVAQAAIANVLNRA